MDKLLNDLYLIHSPSGKEDHMVKYVSNYLVSHKIPHEMDEFGQLYRINPGKPLVCAHMDEVHTVPCTRAVTSPEGVIYGYHGESRAGLGADDKNGIWVILNLILRNPDISFIFSTQEERGGMVDTLLQDDQIPEIRTVPYALIFDRRGPGDIIGVANNYCNTDLEQDATEIGEEFGYYPAVGVWSDCDLISTYVPCINISCGYYGAHTAQEYTVISDLKNALKYGIALLTRLKKVRYSEPPDDFITGIGCDEDIPGAVVIDSIGVYYQDYGSGDEVYLTGEWPLNGKTYDMGEESVLLTYCDFGQAAALCDEDGDILADLDVIDLS